MTLAVNLSMILTIRRKSPPSSSCEYSRTSPQLLKHARSRCVVDFPLCRAIAPRTAHRLSSATNEEWFLSLFDRVQQTGDCLAFVRHMMAVGSEIEPTADMICSETFQTHRSRDFESFQNLIRHIRNSLPEAERLRQVECFGVPERICGVQGPAPFIDPLSESPTTMIWQDCCLDIRRDSSRILRFVKQDIVGRDDWLVQSPRFLT